MGQAYYIVLPQMIGILIAKQYGQKPDPIPSHGLNNQLQSHLMRGTSVDGMAIGAPIPLEFVFIL